MIPHSFWTFLGKFLMRFLGLQSLHPFCSFCSSDLRESVVNLVQLLVINFVRKMVFADVDFQYFKRSQWNSPIRAKIWATGSFWAPRTINLKFTSENADDDSQPWISRFAPKLGSWISDHPTTYPLVLWGQGGYFGLIWVFLAKKTKIGGLQLCILVIWLSARLSLV